MYVIDDTNFSREPCRHGTQFTFSPNIRVVRDNGARADTGALTLGRRVSVFISEGTLILQSCPPITVAARVVIY